MYTAENQVSADMSPELSNYILNMLHYHFPVIKYLHLLEVFTVLFTN